MMTRLSLALLGSSLLFTSACAEEPKASTLAPVASQATQAVKSVTASSPADWRDVDLENTLYITTVYGVFVVELAHEFAPKHVEQIKTLARQKFYDDITFHRVIDGFMNQTGDPKGDGTGDSQLPDINAEFTFRRAPDMAVALVGREMTKVGEADAGFYKSFPVATQPIGQSMLTKDGKVEAWGLHCEGTTSMARGGGDVNSGNSQFFLMRGEYASLNRDYSIWGMTVWGREFLNDIKVGTMGDTPNFVPDMMLTVRVAADVPEAERIAVQVMKTDSTAFRNHVNSLKSESGKLPDVCDIAVPSRLKP